MIEKPMLFSGEMVRALLDGRKSQTRRIVKLQPQSGQPSQVACDEWETSEGQFHCPHPIGSRIWVKETWRQGFAATSYSRGIVYRADKYKALGMDEYSDRHKWKPSIFMAKDEARIWLEVTQVRVQRVQEISEEDAKAEGVQAEYPPGMGPAKYVLAYRTLWDSINGKTHPWSSNPWVWAYTLKRISQVDVNQKATKEREG